MSATETPVTGTLFDLFKSVPGDKTAVIVPEQNIKISYESLRSQVEAVTAQLAAAGVSRGGRVGMAVPTSRATIVCFLASSMAGTAAPLNPAYKEEEFRFYLDDTAARVLILPSDGLDAARKAAGDTVKVLTVSMDAN